jgi:hypothetical protein
MGTVRDYFDSDPDRLTCFATWTIQIPERPVDVVAKVAFDFESNSTFWYLYIPPISLISDLRDVLTTLRQTKELAACTLGSDGNGVLVRSGFSGYSEEMASETLVFTKRIHLYVEHRFTEADRKSIALQFLEFGFVVNVRDREYAERRSAVVRPLAFISHDSRDKDGFVRALVTEFAKLHCPVWYDEYSLKPGDRLRESIEKGLKEAQKCILVLSPNFLSNTGWSRHEFETIFAREMIEKSRVMVPVWLNVGKKEVYDYCASLTDVVAVMASKGPPQVARELAGILK